MKYNPIIHKRTIYFCAAHIAPLFELPDYFNLLKTADYDIPNFKGKNYSVKEYVENKNELRPLKNYYSDYIYIAINEIINEKINEIDYVCFTLHRKIISRINIGNQSINFKGMNILNSSSKEYDLEFDKKSNLLISKPLEFSDFIIGQYKRKHSLKDFEMFTNFLIDSNIIESHEINKFKYSKLFIPALPVGVMPVEVFNYISSNIARFIFHSDKCKFNIQLPYDPYQSRARSFFIERLNSYLFLKYLNNYKKINNLSDSDFGTCVTFNDQITESPVYIGGKI